MSGPAVLLRARLPLRAALSQQGLGFLTGRQFSTNSEPGESLVDLAAAVPGADHPATTAAAAADAAGSLADASASLAHAAVGMDVSSPVSAAIQAVDALHAATGMPWWATISAVGIMVRLAMMPVTLQGMKASAAAMPLLAQARQQAAEGLGGPAAAAQPPQQQEGQQEGQQQQQQSGQQPSLGQILTRFHELRHQQGAPHPAWIVGSPLIQFPVFVTAMWSVRRMSLAGWEGFSTGGLAWFTDLTLPAMDLASFNAPMGNAGIILPLTVAVSMYANIDAGFSPPAASAKQPPSVQLWVLGKLRLLLEWMVVPMFVISLQLPQGALCYWATTSTFSLAQSIALRNPSVRGLVGLPKGRPPLLPPSPLAPQGPLSLEGELGGLGPKVGAATEGPREMAGWAKEEEVALRHFLATTRDQGKLFERAAELRVEGKVGAAITVLRRLLQLHPKQPRALFALGQLHALLRDWRASEGHYLDSANCEADKHQKGRAWFGMGVALHMQQEHETAVQAFQKAAKFAQEDELRLRAWVSEATLHKSLGNTDRAVELLRRAATLEPKVEELYLRPLLEELEQKGEKPPPAE